MTQPTLDEAILRAAQQSRGMKPRAQLADLSDEAVMQRVREKIAELGVLLTWAKASGLTIRWEVWRQDGNHPDKSQRVSFDAPRISEAFRSV